MHIYIYLRNSAKWITFLHFFIISVLCRIGDVVKCPKEGNILFGQYMFGYNFTVIYHSSVLACAAACYEYIICGSFNFDKITKTCYLNYANESIGNLTMEGSSRYLYSNIAHWSKSIAGACAGHSCRTDERCSVARNNSPVCVAIPPVKQDNHFKIVLSEEERTWDEAKEECSKQNGNLSIVDTQEKGQSVKRLITGKGVTSYVWLGATDETEGEWMWINGEPVTFNMWWRPNDTDDGKKQPNNYKNEDCLAVIYNTADNVHPNGRWDWFDAKCEDKHKYLCEFP